MVEDPHVQAQQVAHRRRARATGAAAWQPRLSAGSPKPPARAENLADTKSDSGKGRIASNGMAPRSAAGSQASGQAGARSGAPIPETPPSTPAAIATMRTMLAAPNH